MAKDRKLAEVFRLVDGCSDLTLPRTRLADLLVCDDAEIEKRLDAMGMSSCNGCSVWTHTGEFNVEDPDHPGSHFCDCCATENGLLETVVVH